MDYGSSFHHSSLLSSSPLLHFSLDVNKYVSLVSLYFSIFSALLGLVAQCLGWSGLQKLDGIPLHLRDVRTKEKKKKEKESKKKVSSYTIPILGDKLTFSVETLHVRNDRGGQRQSITRENIKRKAPLFRVEKCIGIVACRAAG